MEGGGDHLSTSSVLIVDDEIPLSQHLEKILQRKGFITKKVHNGAAATREIRKFVPDVVLLDLRLPDADGRELLPKLKKDSPDRKSVV